MTQYTETDIEKARREGAEAAATLIMNDLRKTMQLADKSWYFMSGWLIASDAHRFASWAIDDLERAERITK